MHGRVNRPTKHIQKDNQGTHTQLGKTRQIIKAREEVKLNARHQRQGTNKIKQEVRIITRWNKH